jgi:NADH-quinone oxidoreductase subunit C
MTRHQTLKNQLVTAFGDHVMLTDALGELTLDVPGEQFGALCERLRTDNALKFETCIDLCGVDYLSWGNSVREATAARRASHQTRYAVVIHLLSLTYNWRLRVRAWVANDDFPVIPTLINCWPSVNWFEREAFDLYGIVFEGHPDLRRILTDYGFIGHPFRKDFPLSGTVEMRYDAAQRRVIYQPVTIVPREVTPRVVREDAYGAGL